MNIKGYVLEVAFVSRVLRVCNSPFLFLSIELRFHNRRKPSSLPHPPCVPPPAYLPTSTNRLWLFALSYLDLVHFHQDMNMTHPASREPSLQASELSSAQRKLAFSEILNVTNWY